MQLRKWVVGEKGGLGSNHTDPSEGRSDSSSGVVGTVRVGSKQEESGITSRLLAHALRWADGFHW